MAAQGPFAAVLVIPEAAMSAAVRMMDDCHTRRIIDECCRFSALRHLTVTQLARLAQFCTVCISPQDYHAQSHHVTCSQAHAYPAIALYFSVERALVIAFDAFVGKHDNCNCTARDVCLGT